MKDQIFQTVLETPEFIRQSESCMDIFSKDELISYISANPLIGSIISGAGGARKLRWGSGNDKGKRGGVRVIYYYHDQSIPIFLFTAYAKNQRADISQKDRNILKVIIKQVVKAYGGYFYE